MSKRARTTKSKSNRSFIELADADTLKEFEQFLDKFGVTIDEISENSSARCAICIYEIQQFLKENPYKPENLTRSKRLFAIGGPNESK